MEKLIFAVHSADETTRTQVARALAATGRAEVLPAPPRLSALRELLAAQRVDGLYVDLDQGAEELLELLEQTPGPRPTLLFGGSCAEPTALMRAMRLQPLDFLLKHDVASLPQRIEQLAKESVARSPAPVQLHGVLAVAGSKGGVGATFVACELAAALQQRGERAMVLDLNLRFSDAALYLDLRPQYTLADVARKGDALDETFLETAVAPHASGVKLLAGPSNAEEAGLVGARHVELAVSILREQFDWLVVDLPGVWDELSLRALNAADQILLVTRADVPSLVHTKQQLELLERLGAPGDRLRVVLNRFGRGSAFSEKEVDAFLGRQADWILPADDAVAGRCTNEGKLLGEAGPGSKLERAFGRLAELSHQWVRGKPESVRGSWLAELLKRAKGG